MHTIVQLGGIAAVGYTMVRPIDTVVYHLDRVLPKRVVNAVIGATFVALSTGSVILLKS